MMRHSVLLVGRLRRPFFRDAVQEYRRRISGYARIDLVEVPVSGVTRDEGQDPRVIEAEGRALLSAAASLNRGYWIALDESGKMATSKGLAAFVEKRGVGGDSHLVWFVGGPLGLSDEVKERCPLQLALSRMTFPHEMVPVILLEQIYRVHTILRGEPYHH
ncbi:MAG: 23S rRNA (pseudouridine(1915)-N(3))-methyltransferase RlmH [Clostridia bacterium]